MVQGTNRISWWEDARHRRLLLHGAASGNSSGGSRLCLLIRQRKRGKMYCNIPDPSSSSPDHAQHATLILSQPLRLFYWYNWCAWTSVMMGRRRDASRGRRPGHRRCGCASSAFAERALAQASEALILDPLMPLAVIISLALYALKQAQYPIHVKVRHGLR